MNHKVAVYQFDNLTVFGCLQPRVLRSDEEVTNEMEDRSLKVRRMATSELELRRVQDTSEQNPFKWIRHA